jgi:hypothetical protein
MTKEERQAIIAKCYVVMAEVDWEFAQWRHDIIQQRRQVDAAIQAQERWKHRRL